MKCVLALSLFLVLLVVSPHVFAAAALLMTGMIMPLVRRPRMQ